MILETRHLESLMLLVWECREQPGKPNLDLLRTWASMVLESGEIDNELAGYIVERYRKGHG